MNYVFHWSGSPADQEAVDRIMGRGFLRSVDLSILGPHEFWYFRRDYTQPVKITSGHCSIPGSKPAGVE